MKKILSLFISLAILATSLFYSGCGLTSRHRLKQDEDDVLSIEITSSKYGGMACNEDTPLVVSKIEDISAFLKDFNDLEFESVAPPMSPYPNAISIVITYKDGAFEQITLSGSTYIDANGSPLFGSRIPIVEQYRDLISKYTSDDPIKMEYNYLEREALVTSIEIVEILKISDIPKVPEQMVLFCTINDCESFLADFSQIDCFFNKSFPSTVAQNEKAIRITYETGCSEYIGVSGQFKVGSDERCAYGGDRYFDNEQFNQLIERYVNGNQ